MRLGIATDFGGFERKGMLAAHLRRAGHDGVDVGAHSLNPGGDYPRPRLRDQKLMLAARSDQYFSGIVPRARAGDPNAKILFYPLAR